MGWFPSRMCRTDVVLSCRDRQHFIAEIHEEGLGEIRDLRKDVLVEEGVVVRATAHHSLRHMEELSSRLSRMSHVLARAAPPAPGGLASLFSPKDVKRTTVPRRGPETIVGDVESLMERCEEPLLKTEREYETLVQKKEVLKAKNEALKMLAGFDIDLSLLGRGPSVFVKAGTSPDPEKIVEAMEPYNVIVSFSPAGEDEYAVVAAGFVKEEKKILSALRSSGFFSIDVLDEKGTPREALANISVSMKDVEQKLKDVIASIADMRKDWYHSLAILSEELDIEVERAGSLQKMAATETTYTISMWCPADSLSRLEDVVGNVTKGTGVVYVVEEEEEPPTKIENAGWARPFESLTEMYGTPGYREVDPTKILAPVFIIFFGLMLGDAVYGLIVAVAGAMMYRGARGGEEGMRRFSLILTLSGVSAIVFGILQGGYLGPVMENQPNLLGLAGIHPPVLLDSMSDPITLLIISLFMGLAYINLGLFLAMVQNLKNGEPKAVLLEQVPWWLLQPAGFILLGEGLFGWWIFPSHIQTLGTIMAVVGTGLLVVGKQGLFFFDITGFLGNFLSFARILALGLATAGIALTINVIVDLLAGASFDFGVLSYVIMAGAVPLFAAGILKKSKMFLGVGSVLFLMGFLAFMDASHIFFIALAVVLYVVAHIMNCGLQALGAFIHSLRLQYVEFFGLFFEGAGRPFQPFQSKREITILKEENT